MSWVEIGVVLLGQALTAAAIWGGVRADIRNLVRSVNEAKGIAGNAHRRIDELLLSKLRASDG